MSRASKRNVKSKVNSIANVTGFGEGGNYHESQMHGHLWQSAAMNDAQYRKNLNQIYRLALNRFRWEGLPNGCSQRYLETALLERGMATIAHDMSTPDAWVSVMAVPTGRYNLYGEPLTWQCLGWGGYTPFQASAENGVIVFANRSWTNPWNTITALALKLTQYDRTEDLNLAMQRATVVWETSEDNQFQLANTVKQVAGFEPVITAINGFTDETRQQVVSTDIDFIGDKLQVGKQNIWNEVYRFLGIDHLAYEKGERMIEEEAKGNEKPTAISFLDEISARRDACDQLNERFGLDVQCYFNDDFESYNFNALNTVGGDE